MFTIVGLGNPDEKYKNTRHNTGRIILDALYKKFDFPEWKFDKKSNALISKGMIEKESALFIKPETYMNKSGASVKKYITSAKKAERLIVVYDDLDLSLGALKISYNKSSGGHRGLDSIIKTLRTKKFIRVRVGISPSTPGGKIKKPNGEKEVEKFILGDFSKKEMPVLTDTTQTACRAIESIIVDGLSKAANTFN